MDRRKIICLLLGLITLALFLPATRFDFLNYDDTDYVVYNPAIQHGITETSLAWAWKSNHASNWHPLTWVSHMADFNLYGLKPGGHHLTNVLFHTANVMLLFLVLLQFTGAPWPSALVAALFGWHPLHVESVAWVSERKDVLSTFFWLLTLWAYGKYVRKSTNGARNESSIFHSLRSGFYWLTLFFFALGLMSKPMVVTLPFVLLLLDYWPLRRLKPAAESPEVQPAALVRLVLEKIPFFVLSALDCLATYRAQRADHAVVSAAALPFPTRIANALVSYVLYLWKTVWPENLSVVYPYSHTWSPGIAIVAGVFLLMITSAALWQARERPYLIVGWLWFIGTLVPVIGLVQVGDAFMADRYSYIPLIGIFMMAGWGLPELAAQWPQFNRVFGALTAGIFILMISRTEMQLQFWRNSVLLFRHATEITQGSILAEYDLGEALGEAGDQDGAAEHYLKALAIQPNPVEAQFNSQNEAQFNLGAIYTRQGRFPDAAAQFEAVLVRQPDNARAHDALGRILVIEGRFNDAVAQFQAAVDLDPTNPRFQQNLDTAQAKRNASKER